MEEILSFKLVLIGESGVGKSSLFYKYIQSNNSKFETMPSEQPQFQLKLCLLKIIINQLNLIYGILQDKKDIEL